MTQNFPPTLYGFQRSTYVNVARLLLLAKGVPFEFHDTEDEMYTREHAKRHPFGRVPVLQHGDFWLYETSAIAMYVDEAFDGPPLLPPGPEGRALVHQWISSLNAYFYPNIVFSLVHERLVFGELGIAADEAVVASSLPKIARCLGVMDSALEVHEWLVGEHATMADYFLLPSIIALSLVPEGRSILEQHQSIGRWLERMNGLPSVQALRSSLPAWAPIEHARRWVADHRAGTH